MESKFNPSEREMFRDLIRNRQLPMTPIKVGDRVSFDSFAVTEINGRPVPSVQLHKVHSERPVVMALSKFLCEENFELVPDATTVGEFTDFLITHLFYVKEIHMKPLDGPDTREPNVVYANKVVLSLQRV